MEVWYEQHLPEEGVRRHGCVCVCECVNCDISYFEVFWITVIYVSYLFLDQHSGLQERNERGHFPQAVQEVSSSKSLKRVFNFGVNSA